MKVLKKTSVSVATGPQCKHVYYYTSDAYPKFHELSDTLRAFPCNTETFNKESLHNSWFLWFKYLKTYSLHLQIWCWDSFLPAPELLSSGYFSLLPPGSACQPSRGNKSTVYSKRKACCQISKSEPFNMLKMLVSSKQGMHRAACWNMSFTNTQKKEYPLHCFGDSDRKTKYCFSLECHIFKAGKGRHKVCGWTMSWSSWDSLFGMKQVLCSDMKNNRGFSLSSIFPLHFLSILMISTKIKNNK